ncbi:hypothetical protein U1Q18_052626 [Sarracenia purpurea var. burkii]
MRQKASNKPRFTQHKFTWDFYRTHRVQPRRPPNVDKNMNKTNTKNSSINSLVREKKPSHSSICKYRTQANPKESKNRTSHKKQHGSKTNVTPYMQSIYVDHTSSTKENTKAHNLMGLAISRSQQPKGGRNLPKVGKGGERTREEPKS